MRSLSIHRTQIGEAAGGLGLCLMSLRESVGVFGDLMETFRSSLEKTDSLFRPERALYLALLQRRLRSLA